MPIEIERKFLVQNLGTLKLENGLEVDQGYLSEGEPTVRVRTMGPKAFLTIKYAPGEENKREGAIVNREYEYEIPVEHAKELLDIAKSRLQKVRYTTPEGIEVDIFRGRHSGLILAEYESDDGSYPPLLEGVVWREVTNDPRYKNSRIARHGVPVD